ncbi:MAG TPA: hypothetical protein VHX38_05410, partial [Pseudonocardiaceae bacterium]|nr:hypothetical protein [Pseudonocardiaceae bacterium]
MIYGILLAGFVPLTALMPSMAQHKDKGAALAIPDTGAGGAAFIGPVIVTALYPVFGGDGVGIAYCLLYALVAILSANGELPRSPDWSAHHCLASLDTELSVVAATDDFFQQFGKSSAEVCGSSLYE